MDRYLFKNFVVLLYSLSFLLSCYAQDCPPGPEADRCLSIDGTCILDPSGKETCVCKRGFEGKDCDIPNRCLAASLGCSFNEENCNPCQNNGKCTAIRDAQNIPANYTCDCTRTQFTGERCGYRRCLVDLLVPFTMEVGASRIFTIILLQEGDNPTFKFESSGPLSFEFLPSLFRPISEFEILGQSYPADAMVYQFSYLFSDPRGYRVEAICFNGFDTSTKKDPVLYIGHRKLELINVFNPHGANGNPGCFLNAHINGAANRIQFSTLYKRSDRIDISVGFRYCAKLLNTKINYKWELHRLDSSFPTPVRENNWGIDRIIADVSKKYVSFKPRELLKGNYLIEVIFQEEGDIHPNTRQAFFTVEDNKPNVVILHGRQRNVNIEEDIVIDASSSKDLGFPERTPELIFHWTCKELGDSWQRSGSIVILAANTLPDGPQYTFVVEVTSPHSGTTATETQIMHPSKIGLVFDCLNCDTVNDNDKENERILLLFCHCPTCATQPKFTFSWEPADPPVDIKVRKDNASIAEIVPPELSAGKEYIANAICTTEWDSVPQIIKFELYSNDSSTKECNIIPSIGTYLVDTFTIICSTDDYVGTADIDYYAEVKGEATDILQNEILLYYDEFLSPGTTEVTNIILPFGNLIGDSIVVRVDFSYEHAPGRISYESWFSDSLKVKIPTPEEYMNQLEEDIFSPNSKLKLLLQNGLEQEALQLQSVIIYGLVSQDPRMDPLIALLKKQNKLQVLATELSKGLTKINLVGRRAISQITESMNLLSTLLHDNEPLADRDDTSVLMESSSNILRVSQEIRNQIREGTVTGEQVGLLGNVVADTASKILRVMSDRGNEIINEDTPINIRNERQMVTQFDLKDDVDRDYFVGDFPDDVDEDWGDREFSVEQENNEKVVELASASRSAIMALDLMMDSIADKQLPVLDPFKYKDTELAIHVGVQKANSFKDEEFVLERKNSAEHTMLKIPGNLELFGKEGDPPDVEIQIREFKENPFFDDFSAIPGTPVVSVVIKDANTKIPLNLENNDNLTESKIEITLPIQTTSKDDQIDSSTGYTVKLRTLTDLLALEKVTDKDMPMRRFILPYDVQVEMAIFEFDPKPEEVSYAVIFLKDERPAPQHFCNIDNIKFIPNEKGDYSYIFETEKRDYSQEEPAETFLEYYIGIWPVPNSSALVGKQHPFKVYFTRTTCLSRDENRNMWSEEGCKAQKTTNSKSVVCSCTHLSVFSASQFVLPNDLQSLSFADFDLNYLGENHIVITTVGSCLFIYLVLLIMCWLWDRRVTTKLVPITIMADLSEDFEHAYYLVTVVTGTRFDAGTSANVSLQICGTNGRSQTYILKEGALTVLDRGSIDNYLVSSPNDLGNLEKIRLWHDNYGEDPSWYCNKIIIRNIKTDAEFHFFVEQWLSVSNINPKLMVEQEIGHRKDKRSIYRIFRDNMANEFNNSHLWLSVMIRPPSSSFTRCQRLSCAYAVLCCYMLLTIMFSGIPTEGHENQFEVGGVNINTDDIILWLENLIFALPIGFVVLFTFKNLREHSIPTLIIWKNKTKPDKGNRPDNVFVPKAPPPAPKVSHHNKIDLLGVVNDRNREGSDTSSLFSLPSTDIQEVEGWVITQTEGEGKRSYEDREPDSFIHAVKEDSDQNHLDRLHRLGRHALVHSVRETDPTSFFFSGDLDIPGVEKLIDEQLRLQASEKAGTKQEPWHDMKQQDLINIENEIKNNTLQGPDPLVTAEEKKESPKGLVIELCNMAPVSKRCGYVPWWFIIPAWMICLGVIIACNYFTVIFGLNYGYLRSLDWLSAVISSFITSVFIIQPGKIIIVAGLRALFIRQLSKVHQDRFQLLIIEDEKEFPGKTPRKIKTFQPDRLHPPLSGHEIFILKMEARRLRELRRKFMYLILYCILLAPLIYIAHSTHSKHNYRVTENLRNMFKLTEESRKTVGTNSWEAFLNIKDELSLFGYLRTTFLPALHPTRLYNGELITTGRFESSVLSDYTTILVGVARVRQLRMSNTSCESSKILRLLNSTCIADYSISKQDTNSYNPLWEPIASGSTRHVSSVSNDIWSFRTADETGSLTIKGWMGYYDGGGYIAELGRNRRESSSVLKYLKQINWFDEYTRCIFIEFGTFTPSLNIFTSVILMMERGSSQGMKITSNIYPMVVLNPEFISDEGDELEMEKSVVATCLFFITCLLVILLIVFMWRILNDRDEEIITTFWFWLDLITILSIVISLFIAYETADVMKNLTDTLDKSLVNEFVNFQRGALWDQIHRVAFSITQIFCFLRVWNVIMYSSDKFLMLTLTLKLTSSILIGFSFLFAMLLIAFAFAGTLLFGHQLEGFYSIPETFVTLAQQTLQVSFFYDLEDANRILGPAYFFCFGIFVVFLTINLFVALLNQGFYQAKEITKERKHWITYWGYIKRFFGKAVRVVTRRRVRKPTLPDSSQPLDILPSRLHAMKKSTIKYIRDKVYSDEEELMKKMKTFADDLLKGTGMHMVSKGEKEALLKINKEKRMDEMRICTAEFLRIKTGVYMTPEELKRYEKYNANITALRINKLVKNVDLIAEKIDMILENSPLPHEDGDTYSN